MDFACITIFAQIRGSISEATFCLCDTYLLLWPGPVGHNQPATNYVPLIADSKPLTTATKLLAANYDLLSTYKLVVTDIVLGTKLAVLKCAKIK